MPFSEVVQSYTAVARELLPLLWEAIEAVFRRHLVLVSYQRWSTDDERVAITVERTVGFVDLVGSTEVLRTVTVSEMAALVTRFEQFAWDVVSAAGGRVVKLIGDEAMFVVDEPAAACRLATVLVDRSPDPVRVGLAHGAVVALRGDFYGPTVNLAARLVSVAEPGRALVSDSVRAGVLATGGADFAFEAVPVGPLQGFPEVATAYEPQARVVPTVQ